MARLGVGIELVGRESELATLVAALDRAADGKPTGMLLAGDAGVGKSRMVAETVERAAAAGFTVLVGRCLDTADAALPYLPFTEVAGAMVAARPELAEEHVALRHLMPGTVAREDGKGEERALGQLRVFDAVLSALDAISAAGPTLLVIEDLHWADRSSRDLLVFLLSRLTAQRLLAVVTYRRDDLHRRHPLRPVLAELVRLPAVERLDLEPLGIAESLELVRKLAEGSMPEAMLARVARRSEGNAFFAEELVTASSDGMPEGLAEVLMSRVENLPAATQRVLRIAAVSGRRVRHDRLAAVSGLPDDELEQALREAVTHHVLVADSHGDGYVFRHALLREAIYQELLPGERTRLHARYAELLAANDGEPGAAAELAHHALAGHDLPRALAASAAASREADERAAPAEMLLHAERALELWSAVPDPEAVAGVDEGVITRWAALAAGMTGDPERAAALGRRALDLTERRGDPVATARFTRTYAVSLLELAGREHEAVRLSRRALTLLAEVPPGSQLAFAHAALARSLVRVDELVEAEEQARAAVKVADALPADDPMPGGAKADALITLSLLSAKAGRSEEARDLLVEAHELARRSDYLLIELRTQFNIGMSLLDAARLEEAAAAFADGETRATETGLTWSAFGIDVRVAHVLTNFMRGAWDEAETAADIAGGQLSVSVAERLTSAGLLVDVARGRIAAAEARFAEMSADWTADEQVIVVIGQASAESALWAGTPAVALRRAEETIRELEEIAPRQLGEISMAALGVAAVAELAARGGLPHDEARVRAAELAEVAEQTAAHGIPRSSTLGPEGHAWLAMARAELSRLTGPDPEAWSAVVTAFGYEPAAENRGYRTAYALLRRAEASLATGEHHGVVEDLRRAAATARTLGAVPLAERIAELAARAGVRLEHSPVVRAEALDQLTPRERAVLALVAGGRTNRQVGAELFISEKTVSVHLSRVMAKLGASSRTEAVSIAYARGLLAPDSQSALTVRG